MADWPPKHLDGIRERYAEWDAWLAGDRTRLETIGQHHGLDRGTGILGKVVSTWRRFWGHAPAIAGQQDISTRIKVHVPLAADIARASSDLLFAEPPSITADRPDTPVVEDGEDLPAEHQLAIEIADATTARLNFYLDNGLVGVCAGAAEICAGMGGVVLRAVGDGERQQVFLSRVDVDSVIPEFDWGRLVRLTVWKELPQVVKGVTHRWFEVHETIPGLYDEQPAKIGVVRHQLFAGTTDKLGDLAPLTEHPFTERFIPDLDAELGDGISTRTPGLDVVYIPNVTPNMLWRTDPVGANLGAPDIAGCEDLLDRLDGIRSSLLEETDLAKARVTVPEQWLQSQGTGGGMVFDNDRRLFVGMNIPPTENSQVGAEMFQPAIRVDEHLRIEQQLVEDILRRCGYSASTFGEDEDAAVTATGVNAKKDRTRLTRGRKIREWQPRLAEIIVKMLAMDVAFEWADPMVEPSLVSVVWPEAQQTPLDLAMTVQAWHTAEAVSMWTRVATIHPDWDPDQIAKEIDRIREDRMVDQLPDPADLGVDGQGLTTTEVPTTMSTDEIAEAATAMGMLIRAGVAPDDAAARVGMPGIKFTGAVPTSLRLPEKDADALEQV